MPTLTTQSYFLKLKQFKLQRKHHRYAHHIQLQLTYCRHQQKLICQLFGKLLDQQLGDFIFEQHHQQHSRRHQQQQQQQQQHLLALSLLDQCAHNLGFYPTKQLLSRPNFNFQLFDQLSHRSPSVVVILFCCSLAYVDFRYKGSLRSVPQSSLPSSVYYSIYYSICYFFIYYFFIYYFFIYYFFIYYFFIYYFFIYYFFIYYFFIYSSSYYSVYHSVYYFIWHPFDVVELHRIEISPTCSKAAGGVLSDSTYCDRFPIAK
ncbi:hypothetical protein HER10_EVM0012528 [Colletotrichum scovillei]|uniref:uncharacterized protein n=1 Tax=Colletotrichum scovillei TaxID=1209932 RepID=UPI0015C409D2|nr:uncharacterized protein HER10_EVM0012528 [Colletotrichum scovillei]KAF4783670.1 hypothetical protein HER10_EVM0012528 [Colletotrichum scovillei]